MMHADDQAWLDGLAGRDGSGDGAALRRALQVQLRIEEDVDADSPESSRARAFALIARARRDGVLKPDRSSAAALLGSWLAGWRGALVMATVAGVAIIIGLSASMPRFEETVRGPTIQRVMLYSDEPAELRTRIVEALVDVNVDAYGYMMQGLDFVDATLPSPIPPEVDNVLARYGIAVPDSPSLRVVIARPSR